MGKRSNEAEQELDRPAEAQPVVANRSTVPAAIFCPPHPGPSVFGPSSIPTRRTLVRKADSQAPEEVPVESAAEDPRTARCPDCSWTRAAANVVDSIAEASVSLRGHLIASHAWEPERAFRHTRDWALSALDGQTKE